MRSITRDACELSPSLVALNVPGLRLTLTRVTSADAMARCPDPPHSGPQAAHEAGSGWGRITACLP